MDILRIDLGHETAYTGCGHQVLSESPVCTLGSEPSHRTREARAVGRKKMTKTEEKIDIRLRVDEELHKRIQTAADEEGNSVAAFIRAAVLKELKRRQREE
jgi:hypothetical protein